MSTLFVMRHGQASFGHGNYDRLSELGRAQARLTGEHLADLGASFDAAYCGDMARQQDTARGVLESLASPPPLAIVPGFNEYSSGPVIEALLPELRRADPALDQAVENMFDDRRSFQMVYEAAMMRWISGSYEQDLPETWEEFLARVGRSLDQVLAAHKRGKRVIVFTSGGPISAIMQRALGLEHQTAMKLTYVIKNASLSSFLYNREDFSLSEFNSTTHLEGRGRDEMITYR
ncbi:MAG: histidine phosphatase family protein [Desulfarculaceae bacterium]|nr:histidine phosphatase family protein [Desulfarculaceae bacterium]MCF8071685.1 histidine phosphatase family protein [Desulfarculaceae bacterium]MCF8102468.1 histidine phosphatase family protein [Desulfarculaceae bacterium]MCF8116810.1 histidine phosphatase family protein [Desulfarculaceae bacterium]